MHRHRDKKAGSLSFLKDKDSSYHTSSGGGAGGPHQARKARLARGHAWVGGGPGGGRASTPFRSGGGELRKALWAGPEAPEAVEAGD